MLTFRARNRGLFVFIYSEQWSYAIGGNLKHSKHQLSNLYGVLMSFEKVVVSSRNLKAVVQFLSQKGQVS